MPIIGTSQIVRRPDFGLSLVATELFSWGSGANYQLGTGNAHIQKLPCKVDSLNGSIIKLISAAKFHSVALTDRGEVYTWGFGRGGRLGHPDFDIHRYMVCFCFNQIPFFLVLVLPSIDNINKVELRKFLYLG